MKEHIIKGVKITLGVLVSIFIAEILQMDFYSSVGTIVLVSMLDKKKKTLRIAGIRLFAAVISLSLSSALFLLFGFSLWVFGLYLLIFAILMSKFDTMVAIVLNVVLVMHIYSLGEVSLTILLNEFGLMLLGIIIALIFNFYTLDIEGELVEHQKQLEDQIDLIFDSMGLCLINAGNAQTTNLQLRRLREIISAGKSKAYAHMNSYYIQNNNYYVEYYNMRSQQYYILLSMQKLLKREFYKKSEVKMLKYFTDNFVGNIKSFESSKEQLKKVKVIKKHFKNTELPKTHVELKNRMSLHQYLYSLEEIMILNLRFIERCKSFNKE